ncbi:hypothetical protein MA16_Dca026725 [Dendrobium catenatum]|uniref:Transmembrane 9 superfamily member n=1 Tax=Dendrobium catenatum TaxID=906689 RepID=A0A2I0V720_9ASPA|nr:hypothetical protein MA16_Dca026725 [Dendrobium catenatum]
MFPPPRSTVWIAFAIFLLLHLSPLHGFYLPGSYPHKYPIGDSLFVKVNSLTSIDTEIPFGYYSLPFCRPLDGIKDSAENLGELLMGDRIENSPYRFRMFTNESDILLCRTDPLSIADLNLLKKRIDEMYQVNVLLENLPLKDKQPLVFTYEVSFVERDIHWPSWWDAYLKMEGAKVHWFSILNSLMVIAFLAGIVLVIFLRTVRRDLTRYEELDKEAQAQMNEELSGWKLVVGDVFRVPGNATLLCVMVGDGVQILGMAVVTILFAALGFMSPASRGALITGMFFFYLVLGIAAGYAAVRIWKTIKGGNHTGWMSVSWKVACFFPGIAFLILTTQNFLLWGSHSTGAIPFSLFIILILSWFCISVPLTFVGGYLGAKAPHVELPVRTNQIPREIPPQKYPSWLLVLGAGTLPFGTLFIELFFIMSSLWMGRVYYVFGFLFIVLIFMVVVCAEVSLVLTYMHLCVEDWKWWWKSFFSSGSVAIYVFLYYLNYLIFDLESLSGPVSASLYLGYSLFIAEAIMLATGTVGFLSSFWFVHYLFSSVKLD